MIQVVLSANLLGKHVKLKTLPTPSPDGNDASEPHAARLDEPKSVFLFTAEQREAGRVKRLAKIAHWATLDTRQSFADAAFMRGIVRAAGLTAPPRTEPASVSRLRVLLRRVSIHKQEIEEAVGTSLEGFLELNPKLPLWVALSAILESTGKYSDKAAVFAEEEMNDGR